MLVGETITYTLSATNPSSVPGFNLCFRDVLPLGVTYDRPSTPSAAGEPDIHVANVEFPAGTGSFVPQQTLVWSNVADLQVNDTFELGFGVALDLDDLHRRGDRHSTGTSYASTDPWLVPQFDPVTGAPAPNPDPAIQTSPPSATTTAITAIRVTKTEPSPKGELLRGVHDFVTTYTLTVNTTSLAGVNGVVVSDLLPAQLEFLGCNDVNNSVPDTEKYTGTDRLEACPPIDTCIEPVSVKTVVIDGAIFTCVTWNIETSQRVIRSRPEYTIRYASDIPLYANELYTCDAPTPPSLQQSSNLTTTPVVPPESYREASITNRVTTPTNT